MGIIISESPYFVPPNGTTKGILRSNPDWGFIVKDGLPFVAQNLRSKFVERRMVELKGVEPSAS